MGVKFEVRVTVAGVRVWYGVGEMWYSEDGVWGAIEGGD